LQNQDLAAKPITLPEPCYRNATAFGFPNNGKDKNKKASLKREASQGG